MESRTEQERGFAELWERTVSRAGEATFLTFDDLDGSTTSWSYGEFDALVDRVADRLAADGAGPGRSIHLALANSPAFVAVWLAGVRLGAPVVPCDPQSTERELREQMVRTGATVGICSPDRDRAYTAAAGRALRVRSVAETDPTLGSLLAPAPERERRAPDAGDRAAIMFTSGTTSAPKGVVITQRNYAFAGEVMAAAAQVAREDRLLVVLPLFHANAQYYSFAAAIATGAHVVLAARFSAGGFLPLADRHRATHASLFAAPIRMILARSEPGSPSVSLRHCWFAQRLSTEEYRAFSELVGCRPRQLYGMTETLAAVLTQDSLAPAPHHLGAPTVGCRVALGPEEGAGSELLVGGRRGRELFDGYLDDPETTEEAFSEGWFHTGDLVRHDDEGNLLFAGRRTDTLKVAGENVSVSEVEAVLAEHPEVAEVAVTGAPDLVRDEVPVAHVVPSSDILTETDLLEWCAKRLAPSKRPRRIVLRSELPRTSVGKVRRSELGPPPDSGEKLLGPDPRAIEEIPGP